MKKFLVALIFTAFPMLTFGQECSNEYPEVFERFFEHFSTNTAFALSRTRLPLQKLKWEYEIDEKGNDSSAPEKSTIFRDDYISWPSLAAYMEKNGLAIIRRRKNGRDMVVDINKESTDWLFSYHFKMESGCWYFWQYEDQSQ